MNPARILVVDDEPEIRSLVQEILEDEGYQVNTAEDASTARDLREQLQPDLILLDIWMPGTDGISLLKEWKANPQPDCPVVMMSGHGTVETAIESTRSGAASFVEKPLSMAKLIRTVEEALLHAPTAEPQSVALQPEFDEIPVGRSLPLRRLLNRLNSAAHHHNALLLTGARGSGKKLAVHYLMQQDGKERPLVYFSSSQMPLDSSFAAMRNALERQLLRVGTGVLYIPELTELGTALQSYLLAVIRTREFVPTDRDQPQSFQGRVIMGSAENLRLALQQEKLISEFEPLLLEAIAVPSLAERVEDIPELLEFYANYYSEQHQLPYRHFSVASQNFLRNQDWSGNLAALKSLVFESLNNNNEPEVEPEEAQQTFKRLQLPFSPNLSGINLEQPLRAAREDFERLYFQYWLQKSGGNMTELARHSGQERTSLYRKLKQLGLTPGRASSD